MHAYSYPYFKNVNKFTIYSTKLSELKNDINNILNKEHDINVSQFIKKWNEDYCFALNTDDANLLTELQSLSLKMVEIGYLYEKECDIKREQREKERHCSGKCH
jgi:hypothetical protein